MSQENVEVVHRWYAALSRRDLATMDELSHEHVRYHTRIGAVGGRVYGFGELAAYFADVDEVWDDVRQTAMDIVSLDDNRVVLTVRYQARAEGSGIHADQRLGVIAELSNGKVERLEAYPSRQAALEAAGLRE